MRIKEVALEGFKSYAQRISVGPFDPSFNAITGPNGTGKSNLLDGILFAMGFRPGEQMRVNGLEELIYKRGQAGVVSASVTIIFDNSDKHGCSVMYQDCDIITVTRQYSVGGRDRYFINGKLRRLKDIYRFFEECRLSVNVSIHRNPDFLVMQGSVSRVLTMGPQGILGMLKDSSGTGYFDVEKKNSEKVLEEKNCQLNIIQKNLNENLNGILTYLRQQKEQYLSWLSYGQEIPELKEAVSWKRLELLEKEEAQFEEERARDEKLILEKEEKIKKNEKKIQKIEKKIEKIQKLIKKIQNGDIKRDALDRPSSDHPSSDHPSSDHASSDHASSDESVSDSASSSEASDADQPKTKKDTKKLRLKDLEKEKGLLEKAQEDKCLKDLNDQKKNLAASIKLRKDEVQNKEAEIKRLKNERQRVKNDIDKLKVDDIESQEEAGKKGRKEEAGKKGRKEEAGKNGRKEEKKGVAGVTDMSDSDDSSDLDMSGESRVDELSRLELRLSGLDEEILKREYQLDELKKKNMVDVDGENLNEKLNKKKQKKIEINLKKNEIIYFLNQSAGDAGAGAAGAGARVDSGRIELLERELKKSEDVINLFHKKLELIDQKKVSPEEHKLNNQRLQQLQNEHDQIQQELEQLYRTDRRLTYLTTFDQQDRPTQRQNLCGSYADDKPGIIGMAAEVFNVKEEFYDEFILALEEAGKSRLRHIVIEDEKIATSIFNWARKNGERITCIPISKLQLPPLNRARIDQVISIAEQESEQRRKAEESADTVALALDMVKSKDEQYSGVLRYVFHETLVCGDQLTGKSIMENARLLVITAKGDRLDPLGSISGGSVSGLGGNFLKRCHVGCEYRLKMRQIMDEMKELRSTVVGNEVAGTDYERVQNDLDLHMKIHQSKLDALAILTKPLEEKKKLAEKIESSRGELKLLEEAEFELCEEIKKIEVFLSKNEDFLKKKLENKIKNLKNKKEKYLNYKKIFIKKNAQKIQNETQINQLTEVLLKLEGEISSMSDEVSKMKSDLKGFECEMKDLLSDVAFCESLIVELENLINKKINKIEEKKMKNFEKISKIKKIKIKNEKKIQENQKIKNLIQKMKKNPNQKPPPQTTLTLQQLEEKLEWMVAERNRLQLKVDKRCIERLAIVEKQFEAIEKERISLIEEMKALMRLIESIDEKKEAKLQKAFVHVSKVFDDIFSTLLPGAQAKLDLVQPPSIDSGITLNVVFNGLKKQSLTDLSGGQKSLLALSFILSLLKLNPAPFYILDEIDAALDESHTQNLSQMIATYFPESQFIVVSHKDNFYGNARVLFRTAFEGGSSVVHRETAV